LFVEYATVSFYPDSRRQWWSSLFVLACRDVHRTKAKYISIPS
jgi:hypothetical protein